MKDQLTAVIIPFPGRTRQAPEPSEAPVEMVVAPVASALPLATPTPVATRARQDAQELSSSSQRLTQALTSLSAALADQRDATQRWKAAIEDLASKMRSLGDMGLGEKKLG